MLDAAGAMQHYGADTSGQGEAVPAALLIRDRAEVSAVLVIARRHRIPLYPISTGRNWGYGGASPVLDGCAVLDLSGMNRIVELDRELGLVTVEPGVTQGQLREYLDRHAPRFMVPTTGAGPNCSLIGNALERGYGITPYADHFGAITALEAVLPDGRLYRSALAELGAETVDRAFKWGLGPYLDGLFAQGNIGIVTQMTIALALRPERVEAFFFGIAEEGKLEAAVLAVQGILRAVGGTVGAINLMNARRVLAMTVPYPAEFVGGDGVLAQDVVLDLARRHRVRAWMGVGALYGNGKVVKAARRVVRQLLRPVADRIVFLTPERSALLGRLVRSVPGLSESRIAKLLGAIDQSLEVMAGRPSEVALRLVYWRAGRPPPEGALNPARDGSGLIWYSPLVPMRPAAVRNYVAMVHEVCLAHGIEPLITLTSLTDRCFDSTIPLLFDRGDPGQAARAAACFDALFEAGRSQGFMPYRLGIQSMSRVTGTPSPFWDLVGTIKSAIDPDGIIAPGRYAPVSASIRTSSATEVAK
ncbi:MAG TPA: FAD-binding oxidoreductase [Acetobacteraceae bacterium]|nr:FAD-binding oxidoreductase [Acetobacteraceae bacterium]